jgi:hypothetical protein
MDADAKILPKDKADVVAWLAQMVQRKRLNNDNLR